MTDFGLRTHPTKMQVAVATIGMSAELVMKSKKSRNCILNTVTSPHGPYPSAENVARNMSIAAVKNVAALRSRCRRSQTDATHASKREMALVAAANVTRRKNASPIHAPAAPRVANTLGSVMNMSPGPAFIAEWTAASVAAAVSPPCCAISSGVTPVLTANM